ncbi:DUF2817 domain-containing protein [Poriferisphaera sp. WC338]|uniref:DUF2817 domain-containing protein n=1 Tax=Poriferisphaera sp. WC338 TaxID=3425129 RepID=UPI003D8158F2
MNHRSLAVTFLGLLMFLWMGGCSAPGGAADRAHGVRDGSVIKSLNADREIIGQSVLGRAIPVIRLTCEEEATSTDVQTVLIVGGIHGNEAASTPMLWQLIGYMKDHPDLVRGRRVVIVPAINPDGVKKGVRYNANGIDLNRNFNAKGRKNSKRYGSEGLTEPESRVLRDLVLAEMPDRIIVMHQPLRCIDYDGPAEKIAAFLAGYCDLPVKKLGSRPGSLGSWAGNDLKIPIITFELHRDANKVDQLEIWKRYHRAVLAFVTYPQPLVIEEGWQQLAK